LQKADRTQEGLLTELKKSQDNLCAAEAECCNLRAKLNDGESKRLRNKFATHSSHWQTPQPLLVMLGVT